MRKDPYQRTIDPLKVYNDHGLTFEHLSYQAVPLDAIERFVSARRQAIIDLLKCPLIDGAQRQGIMQRTRDAWAQTLVAAQEAIEAPVGDLDVGSHMIIGPYAAGHCTEQDRSCARC